MRHVIDCLLSSGWNASGIDVLLCPVTPGAAPPLDCSRYWGYSSVWNLLDYPALVFPVSRVDLHIDGKWAEDGGLLSPRNENEMERYNVELCKCLVSGKRVWK